MAFKLWHLLLFFWFSEIRGRSGGEAAGSFFPHPHLVPVKISDNSWYPQFGPDFSERQSRPFSKTTEHHFCLFVLCVFFVVFSIRHVLCSYTTSWASFLPPSSPPFAALSTFWKLLVNPSIPWDTIPYIGLFIFLPVCPGGGYWSKLKKQCFPHVTSQISPVSHWSFTLSFDFTLELTIGMTAFYSSQIGSSLACDHRLRLCTCAPVGLASWHMVSPLLLVK